jgi:hypothetical protein
MSEPRPVLPLLDAYKFGHDHDLDEAVNAIKNMAVVWPLSYSSTVRRGFIVDLFKNHGLYDAFVIAYWPFGKTPPGQNYAAFTLRIKERYERFLQTGGDDQVDEEDEIEGQSFAAESDLRDFLAENPGCIEKGLRIHTVDEKPCVEFSIDNGKGRIDLLGIDSKNRFVVVELKVSRGRDRTMGQILYYMGWVDSHLSNSPCRGIIIAKEITADLELASKRVPGVSLCRYDLSVTVQPVAGERRTEDMIAPT